MVILGLTITLIVALIVFIIWIKNNRGESNDDNFWEKIVEIGKRCCGKGGKKLKWD